MQITEESGFGNYVAKSNGTTSNLVTVKRPEREAAAEPPPREVAEVTVGELDVAFLWITWSFVIAGLVAIGALVAHQFDVINALAGDASQQKTDSAPFAQRTASQVQLFAAAAGAGLLLVGAWLGALETRGRFREATAKVNDEPGTRGQAEAGKAIADVIDKLTFARATIAVLAVGAILLLAALWASVSVANPGQVRAPSSSTTPTPNSVSAPSNSVQPTP